MIRTLSHTHFAFGATAMPAGLRAPAVAIGAFTGAGRTTVPTPSGAEAQRNANPHALAQRSAP